MREKGFNVGGEQSGHIILSDYATTGDGLVAAMQVLAVVRKLGKPASEVCRRFEPVPQVLRNVRFNGGEPLKNLRRWRERSRRRPRASATAAGSWSGRPAPSRSSG